jgi:hypothetical protein
MSGLPRSANIVVQARSSVDLRIRLARRAHHAVAEALHLELADVASSAFAFAIFLADQVLAPLLQRRLLRGVRRSGHHHERNCQQDHPHLKLLELMRSPERDCARLCLSLGVANVKALTPPPRFAMPIRARL